MEEMYKFANTILPEYNQDHLMLRPPQHMTISSDFAVQLNSNLVYASNSSIVSKPRYASGVATIQLLKTAPKNSILFGCNRNKIKPSLARWKRMLDQVE